MTALRPIDIFVSRLWIGAMHVGHLDGICDLQRPLLDLLLYRATGVVIASIDLTSDAMRTRFAMLFVECVARCFDGKLLEPDSLTEVLKPTRWQIGETKPGLRLLDTICRP